MSNIPESLYPHKAHSFIKDDNKLSSLQQRNEELAKENHDMETLLIGCILSGSVDKFTPEKLRGTVSDKINELEARIAKMVEVAKDGSMNADEAINQIITIGEGHE